MKMLGPTKNGFEVLWPDTSTESGRKLARNEGIASLVCFFGQYMIRLDDTYLKIESGVPGLEFNKTVYIFALAILAFLVWRVFKWGKISSIIAVAIAALELGVVVVNYAIGTGLLIWSVIMVHLAVQGVRGTFAHSKALASTADTRVGS